MLVDGAAHAMAADGAGLVAGHVEDAGPGTAYAFLLDDDETPLPDPRSRWQPDGVHGPSARRTTTSAFDWTDHAWTGRQLPGA